VSPVERRTTPSTTTIVAVALAGVVTAIALVALVVNLSDSGSDRFEIRLGDERFSAGRAEDRARSIAADGPILFSDLAGGRRDILLVHVGDDPLTGWSAIGAQPPGAPRDCVLRWRPDTADLVDCDGTVWPLDGAGLVTYPVAIEDGDVLVDLNAEFRTPAADDDGDRGDDPIVSGDAPSTSG